jgi:hypothetical protein
MKRMQNVECRVKSLIAIFVLTFLTLNSALLTPAHAATSTSSYICCSTGTTPSTCSGTASCSLPTPNGCTNYASTVPNNCSPAGQTCALYTCSSTTNNCSQSTPQQSNVLPACSTPSPTPSVAPSPSSLPSPSPSKASSPTPTPTPSAPSPSPEVIPSPLPGDTASRICTPQSDTTARATDLITTPNLVGNKFSNTQGICATNTTGGPSIAIPSSKIESYNTLKAAYFTKVNPESTASFEKTTANCGSNGIVCDQSKIGLTGSKDHIYLVPSDLTISNNIGGGGTQTGVIFVQGDLNINTDIKDSSNPALVFIVQKNVLINPNVTQIDAMIIAEGKIYTAAISGTPACVTGASGALTINGSLISLNQVDNKAIFFCRDFTDDTLPAEKILAEPKYFIALKDMFSENRQMWSEIP